MNFAFIFLLSFLPGELLPEKPYNAEVLEAKTICIVRNNHLTIETSYRIRINNPEGDKYSGVRIIYSKNDPATIDYAWIENSSGNIVRKLDKKDITTSSAIPGFSLYDDHFVDHFSFRYNDYPYILCYKYTRTFKQFFRITDWSPAIYDEIPTLVASLSLQVPQNYEVRIHENKVDPCSKKLSGNDITMNWKAAYKEPLMAESCSPFYWENYPDVSIVPVDFSYSNKGSFRNSVEYGNWEQSLLYRAQDLSPGDQEQIRQLTMNCRNDLEKIKTLYHFLQDNTRYIDVTVDFGGWKPYPASYLAAKKYGDCKALSNYLCSILKVAGIKSYYTDIYAGSSYPAPDTLISECFFNHVFVVVPLAHDTVWLESTNNYSPFGYLGTFTQNRTAFIVEKDASRFVHTPALNLNDVLTSGKMKFKIGETNTVAADFDFRLRGEDYDDMVQYKTSPEKEYREKWLAKLFGFRDFTILNWNFRFADRDSAFIDLHTDLELRSFIESYGNNTIINQIKFRIPEFEPPDKRKLDVVISSPVSLSDTVEYDFPADFTSASIPPDTLIKTRFGNYRRQIEIKDRKTLILRKSLDIFSCRYPLGDYPEFYSFIKSIRHEDNKLLTIKN